MGIVHRLDKDTSGIMVIAKTLQAHNSLVKQLQDRTITKTYSALVIGTLISGDSIVTYIGRDPRGELLWQFTSVRRQYTL